MHFRQKTCSLEHASHSLASAGTGSMQIGHSASITSSTKAEKLTAFCRASAAFPCRSRISLTLSLALTTIIASRGGRLAGCVQSEKFRNLLYVPVLSGCAAGGKSLPVSMSFPPTLPLTEPRSPALL